MKIRKILKDIREFFWPLLEKAEESEISRVSQKDIDLENEDDIKIAFELVQKIYNDEQDRNKTIETKSVVFIGSIGFVVTFIIGITNFLLTGQNVFLNTITAGMVLVAVVLIAYFVRSSWYSIKALTRQKFWVLHFEDIIKRDKNYLGKIIAEIINNSKENSKIINLRVDYMTMAQEYYKRAIVTIFIYCLFVFFVIIGKLQTGSNVIATSPERIASLIRSGGWLYMLIILILIINTVLLVVILRRKKP
jgi:hypothetical protein